MKIHSSSDFRAKHYAPQNAPICGTNHPWLLVKNPHAVSCERCKPHAQRAIAREEIRLAIEEKYVTAGINPCT